jgi:hypothetical protein
MSSAGWLGRAPAARMRSPASMAAAAISGCPRLPTQGRAARPFVQLSSLLRGPAGIGTCETTVTGLDDCSC